ncbi:MAG TPA: glycosyltransferase 87 family protein [Ktedonobacteraceae bacterium]|nr:glycosyltransferase 87 family protein [Ktedonobacteraceae bacterium]
MSIAQSLRSSPELAPATASERRRWEQWRLPILSILLLVSLGFMLCLRMAAPPIDTPAASWIMLWMVSFLPYLAASVLILATRPLEGRWRWVELGIILLGALVLRSILLPLPPNLSHDSWRYLWDARVTLHGYSPYVYAPNDPALVHLRNFIYDNSRFRNVPTLYPPAAQAVYLLSYLIAPDNLVVFKGILVLLEMVTCGALIVLLRSRGLDPSRCLIYAWCPLPIVEFAMQGHHEAITLVFTMQALISSLSSWRWNSVLTGLLVALATLTNIYPILLLLVVLPRRNRAWMITCLAAYTVTVILGYVPYIILGHGQAFGFFSTYVSEHSWNGGSVFLFTQWLNEHLQFNGVIAHILSYSVDLLLVGGVVLAIWWQRQRERISMEVATLILIGTVFSVSTHVFPWYNTALLPWVALLVVRHPQTDRRARENPMQPSMPPPDVENSNGMREATDALKRVPTALYGPLKRAKDAIAVLLGKLGFPTTSSYIRRFMLGGVGRIFALSVPPQDERAISHPLCNSLPECRDPQGLLSILRVRSATHCPSVGTRFIASVRMGLATVMVWYFACASISAYFVPSNLSWPLYYLYVYDPVLIVLGIAVLVGFKRMRAKRKG